jgi:hypothetical protein
MTVSSDGSTCVSAEDPIGARRWAESLPFSTRRELRAGEQAVWRRRAWRLVAQTAAIGAAAIVGVGIGAVAIERLMPELAHAFGGVAGLALSLVGVVGIVGACLVRSPRGRTPLLPRIGGLTALVLTMGATAWAPTDALSSLWLRTPWVAIVLLGSGTIALGAWQRATLLGRLPRLFADLGAAGVDVYAGGRAGARLDVLPSSRVVTGRNGSATERIATTRTAEIAAPQPHAYRTSLPRGVVRAHADTQVKLQRRGLTVDEREELGAHIRRLRRTAWPALGSLFAVALVLALRMLEEPDWHNLVDVVAFGWYALGVVACVAYARRHAAAKKLAIDRDLRWVVTVDDASPRAAGIARLEVLPVSHLAWTEDAAPALWRMHGA